MAASLTDTCRQTAGIVADAYGLTDGWLTDSWITNGKRLSRAAEWLDLNHQIFQFERFHSFPPWEGGREAFVTRRRAGKGK